MPDILRSLPTAVFWICAAAIVVAQVLILRSTRRAWHFGQADASGADGAPLKAAPGIAEWIFAVGPVVVLGLLLWATNRAVMLWVTP